MSIQERIRSHKDVLAVVISIIALFGTWIPFWYRDLRAQNCVNAMIMSFWPDLDGTSCDVVYINRGNRPAAITNVVATLKLRSDPNADPKDIRFNTERSSLKGLAEPFTLQPGQIVTQSYRFGKVADNPSQLGPPNAVLEYFLVFHVVDAHGAFHSVLTAVANTMIGKDGSAALTTFPLNVRLLPSPSGENKFPIPRRLSEPEK